MKAVLIIAVCLIAIAAAKNNKYSEEANSPEFSSFGRKKVEPSRTDGKEKLFRVQKLNLFWDTAIQHLRGEQKLKKLKNELKAIDKEVVKKKQLEGLEDYKKNVEVRLHDLVEKFSLPTAPFSEVFSFIDKDLDVRNSVLNANDNRIRDDEDFSEPDVHDLWDKITKSGTVMTAEDMKQLRDDLGRLDHRLAKKRFLERQIDGDKKDEEVKRRLKEITYKAEKTRKEIETRYLLKHGEL